MFTPGQRRNMLEKALTLGEGAPDALILDLEDAVPPQEKDIARANLAEILHRPDNGLGPFVIVRVNAGVTGRQEADIRAVLSPRLDAILLPKVESPDEVRAAAQVLDALEAAGGLARGRVGLVAAIESARAVHEVVGIACSTPRLVGLMFGAEDYARDLGLPVVRTGAAWELVFARSSIVNAAAIAGIWAVDQVFMDFRDRAGEHRDAVASREIGFSGKCAIHPSQIATLNEVFSPTGTEVANALAVVAAFEEARRAGIGCVMMGGQVVEQPILERARRLLSTDAAIRARGRPLVNRFLEREASSG
ncbi:MAG: CoA ester lyase [Chloroflexota bacterium]|nr:CoA ester lyase [Chloroflexota bacterium]